MEDIPTDQLEIEYDGLRADNVFKEYGPDGKSIFFKFRRKVPGFEASNLAEKFGCTPQTFYNLVRRLDKAKLNRTGKEKGLDMKKLANLEGVSRTQQKIKKMKETTPEKIRDEKKSARNYADGYDFASALEEVMLSLDLDIDQAEWQDFLLRLNQVLLMEEWDTYKRAKRQGFGQFEITDKKAMLDIADKKAKSIQQMIADNITNYGTLISEVAVDTFDMQQRKLEALADMVMELAMQSGDEEALTRAVDLMDMEEDQLEGQLEEVDGNGSNGI